MKTHSLLTRLRLACRPAAQFVLGVVITALPFACAKGQLAITEVQATQSTTPMLRGADYWELTNFGSNTVELVFCWFADDTGFSGAVNLAALTDEPWIGPGESIVFARWRTNVLTSPAEFRQWWGDSNLRSDLRISVAPWSFAFSSSQDLVQLWEATADHTNLVDRVVVFPSDPGDTFTYDTTTGLMNTFSEAGVNGAFRAATTTDVGSPGANAGPVPLRVVETPASAEVDGGSPVTLAVRAYGLPRPRYQWRFNGQIIPGATEPTFTIANAGAAHVGDYTVEVSNGLETSNTPPATLTVNLTERCATIVRAPADLAVNPGHTAILRVEVRGFPLPAIRWQFNGLEMPDATNATLRVPGVDESRAGLYTVRVSNHVANALCTTNASAWLSIAPVPRLAVTEAMASPSTNTIVPGHNDWWELTNVDTNSVNLRGYRFNDLPLSIEGAVTNTDDVVLLPGQSMIWVSDMTPAEFRRWWGEENLPPDLPIISYSGNGLAEGGDAIFLWTPSALYDDEWMLVFEVFDTNETVTLGVSLECDPVQRECGVPSVEGARGAFKAVESDDIGSPGWTSNEQRVRPRVTAILRGPDGTTVTWATLPGRTYELQFSDNLAPAEWSTLACLTAEGQQLTAVDSTAGTQRFYRVLHLPIPP